MTEPLTILMVTGEYPPMEGGVADFSRIVCQHLHSQGHQVHVLTSRGARQDDADGVHVHALLSRWGWRAVYRAMRELVRQVRPDVINIQYQTAAYGMHPAINFLPRLAPKVPCCVTFHDLLVPYLFPKAGPLRWWVNRQLAQRCRAIIITNAQDHQRLAQEPDLPPIEMIPIGSNVPNRLPKNYDRLAWRARWGLPAETLVLCYFGFLNASKGGEELVAALGRLVAAGRDARLLMIGGAVGASDPTNQAYRAGVRQQIADLGLTERVIWTGYLPDEQVSAAFASSDICVLPYRDGVSFRRGSLMAALVHGMPIVTTHPQVPMPELVHRQGAWLAPPEDAAALAQGILAVADDAHLRETLQRGALALARLFDWESIATQTGALFRRIVGRPGDV
jgi:glycosyltransferase involved in cell wall biosynthesis